MTDDEMKSSESAETQKPVPAKKLSGVPDKAASLYRGIRSLMEMTYWTLAVSHYGNPYAHQAWTWVQEQVLPLVHSL
ncbi:hypothetical protein [Streptomyces sp. S1D4-20]|uniref:hypothetical protein n=1 Tax=Streptomyces sp. S1D4-20 TaxID=2594462 RepID=UPI0011649C9E|nr:hypothetical protein [Streptomyces sp. S1D4-20]QDN54157.1 hypothetical protein FNV67_00855 [Streptomyces sp. S1D4-20]